jgi:hypothetical protein
MGSVNLVEWCNTRVSNRNLHDIHRRVDCRKSRISTKSTWNTSNSTSWLRSNYDSLFLYQIVNECWAWVWWNGATPGSATATHLLFTIGLIVGSVPNRLGTPRARLVCTIPSITARFYNNSKPLFRVWWPSRPWSRLTDNTSIAIELLL